MSKALVLSGGGARAAYQVGVLSAVNDILSQKSGPNPFPIICGTSAGAINALALASHAGSFREAVDDVIDIWGNLSMDKVIRTGWKDITGGFTRVGKSFFNQGVGAKQPLALLNNEPLKVLLEEHINFQNINQAISNGYLRAVAITAMAYSSGESVSFFQGACELKEWRRFHRVGRKSELTMQHLMASAAIPWIFPTVKIDKEYYGDGAIRQLSPLSTALHLGAKKIFVIGVGSNRNPAHWGKKKVVRHSPSLGQIFGHLLNSAFIDSLDGDLEHLELINRLLEMIPEDEEKQSLGLRKVDTLVISPSKELDKIAGRNVRYLPKSLRLLMRTTGATARSGGAAAASYLLFVNHFCNELIELGYQDAMWERESIESFFETD
ncbi:patatin-like phospholipase family protein [Marinibactrum halimedae]|uniref:PNPLA domain-containing protein n=1 Tax=Marinibactrum halimedae TaxID=1444977 RepID=A0AA37T681_9GAMM|nr:patatin-like phospholipase family protein [Marinibactrum halimedae]GLS27509.1 hypothetical protein GCM10007877_32280 [Marinibactrum halimedae]